MPQTTTDVIEDDGKKYLVYIAKRNYKCKDGRFSVTSCLKYVGISTVDPTLVVGPSGRYKSGDIQAEEFVTIFTGLKKGEARGVEQAIIDLNSPGLFSPYKSRFIDNIVNSTSPLRVVTAKLRLEAGIKLLDREYPKWRLPYQPQLPEEFYKRGGLRFSGSEYGGIPNCCEK